MAGKESEVDVWDAFSLALGMQRNGIIGYTTMGCNDLSGMWDLYRQIDADGSVGGCYDLRESGLYSTTMRLKKLDGELFSVGRVRWRVEVRVFMFGSWKAKRKWDNLQGTKKPLGSG